MACLYQTFVSEKEQCKNGIKAIFGKPIIDSKFAHDRRRDVVESVTVPLDPSLLVTVPLGLRVARPTIMALDARRWLYLVCNWMYLEITQKFAKRITHIYFTDEIKCTGRGSVTINWGALRCVEVRLCRWKWKKPVFGSPSQSQSSKNIWFLPGQEKKYMNCSEL